MRIDITYQITTDIYECAINYGLNVKRHNIQDGLILLTDKEKHIIQSYNKGLGIWMLTSDVINEIDNSKPAQIIQKILNNTKNIK